MTAIRLRQMLLGEDLIGLPDPDQAVVEQHQAVEAFRRQAEVMGGDHHRYIATTQLIQDVEDAFLGGHIQAGQRLVHQHQLCFLSQGAGDKHSLLLAT